MFVAFPGVFPAQNLDALLGDCPLRPLHELPKQPRVRVVFAQIFQIVVIGCLPQRKGFGPVSLGGMDMGEIMRQGRMTPAQRRSSYPPRERSS